MLGMQPPATGSARLRMAHAMPLDATCHMLLQHLLDASMPRLVPCVLYCCLGQYRCWDWPPCLTWLDAVGMAHSAWPVRCKRQPVHADDWLCAAFASSHPIIMLCCTSCCGVCRAKPGMGMGGCSQCCSMVSRNPRCEGCYAGCERARKACTALLSDSSLRCPSGAVLASCACQCSSPGMPVGCLAQWLRAAVLCHACTGGSVPGWQGRQGSQVNIRASHSDSLHAADAIGRLRGTASTTHACMRTPHNARCFVFVHSGTW